MLNNKEEKIYLDQEGYNQLLQELEQLKKELAENNLEKGEAYSGAVGDGWHDNFAFDEANRRERLLLGRIKECYERLNSVVIVARTEDDDVIDFGDMVNINMVFAPDDIENCWIELVGVSTSHSNGDIQKVSINSPLGKAIYHKHIGEKTDYEVNKHKIIVEILAKEKTRENNSKTR